MEALQRQVDELRALTAMFPEPGEVFMDGEQEERLVQAEALLEQQGQTPAAWNGLHRELQHVSWCCWPPASAWHVCHTAYVEHSRIVMH